MINIDRKAEHECKDKAAGKFQVKMMLMRMDIVLVDSIGSNLGGKVARTFSFMRCGDIGEETMLKSVATLRCNSKSLVQ